MYGMVKGGLRNMPSSKIGSSKRNRTLKRVMKKAARIRKEKPGNPSKALKKAWKEVKRGK